MGTEKYHFLPLESSDTASFLKKGQETRRSLEKWSMFDGISLQAFTFDLPYKKYLMENFVQDFFTSCDVIRSLNKCNSRGQLVHIGIPAESVRMRRLNSTLTTMTVFDRLSNDDNGVARKNGMIRKCPDDFVTPWIHEEDLAGEPYPVENEVRKMFLNSEESDFADVFTKEEQDEFLVRIFRHLVIGGSASLCQYEDMLLPYLTATKAIYKELMKVQSDNESNPKVTSEVVEILTARSDAQENILFEKPRFNNFFYLIIDTEQRALQTFYHYTC